VGGTKRQSRAGSFELRLRAGNRPNHFAGPIGGAAAESAGEERLFGGLIAGFRQQPRNHHQQRHHDQREDSPKHRAALARDFFLGLRRFFQHFFRAERSG